MKENPSYQEWLHATPEERGDTWLYSPLYKKPYESWDRFGREPTRLDVIKELAHFAIAIVSTMIPEHISDRHQDDV